MGGSYHSLSVPRSVHGEVESLVSSWLLARGFERAEDGVLDLNREAERGCLIFFGGEMEAEGPNDAARLARAWFGDEGRAGELLSLQKKKGIFLDPVCDRFARWLGAPPAASQYGSVMAGERTWEGFPEIHLRFRRPGFDPMDGFDLHRLRVESPPLEEAPKPSKPSPGLRLLTGAGEPPGEDVLARLRATIRSFELRS